MKKPSKTYDETRCELFQLRDELVNSYSIVSAPWRHVGTIVCYVISLARCGFPGTNDGNK